MATFARLPYLWIEYHLLLGKTMERFDAESIICDALSWQCLLQLHYCSAFEVSTPNIAEIQTICHGIES